MNILQSTERTGYPSEYLLARLSGRRAFFTKDWDSLLYSPDPYAALRGTRYAASVTPQTRGGVWETHFREHSWIYFQMDSGLRAVFHPYYVYTELKTLLTCLRYKTRKGGTAEIEHVLTFSLLSDEVKGMMKTVQDLPLLLDTLEKNILFSVRSSPRLVRLFLQEGLAGVEQRLTMIIFEWIMTLDLHPAIERFFALTADLKNIMTAWKHLRWGITSEPVFIDGGMIKKSVLLKIIDIRENAEIIHLIHRYTGQSPREPDLFHIERILLTNVSRKTRIIARAYPDIGPILDYLWRCYLEIQNINMIVYGQEIDRAVIKNELIVT